MSHHRFQIGRQLETLADSALFASIPFMALLMAVALVGIR